MTDWQPLKRWLFTTNHKDVGVLYLFTSFYFFVAAGLFALTFRFQLAVPSNTFLQPDEYNQLVTTHGLLMLLWVITPLGAAFANYFVPIQIGARDMAFPRLNALSYWVYLASGMLAVSSFFAGGGTADWGWTTYAPLNTVEFSPAVGGSMMGLALMLLMASSIVATVNFLVTIFRLRAPGMSLMRLPLFTWTWIFTSLLMLWAFPAFVSALSLLIADRAFGTVFFTSAQGGPLLWDHMFWFFGHREHLELHRVGPPHVHDGDLAEPARGLQHHDGTDLDPVRDHRPRLHPHPPRRIHPLLHTDAVRHRLPFPLHRRRGDGSLQFVHCAGQCVPRYLLGRRPLPLHDRRRGVDGPFRRSVLLVPQDDGSDVQRAPREDPLRDLHDRIQPALLPDAHPVRHAEADLHLRCGGLGADQPPDHDRRLHVRDLPTPHVRKPAVECPSGTDRGSGSLGRIFSGVGRPLSSARVQFPRGDPRGLRDGGDLSSSRDGEWRAP